MNLELAAIVKSSTALLRDIDDESDSRLAIRNGSTYRPRSMTAIYRCLDETVEDGSARAW
jgi:hypothetical protein